MRLKPSFVINLALCVVFIVAFTAEIIEGEVFTNMRFRDFALYLALTMFTVGNFAELIRKYKKWKKRQSIAR